MITLQKIAELANVSVSTASRALNDTRDVSPETRALVLRIAKEYDYFGGKKKVRTDNRRKQRLSVAILCPEIHNDFYSVLVAELIRALEAEQCHAVVYQTGFSTTLFSTLLEQCIDDFHIDAIISLIRPPEPCRPCETPIIFSGEPWDKTSTFDYRYDEALQEIFAECCRRKTGRIAFVSDPLSGVKRDAFLRQAAQFGISATTYDASVRAEEAGFQAAESFIKRGNLPQVFVCAYDAIAYGLIANMSRAGIRVPEEVQVIGWNDIPSAQYCFGGLSTIHYNTDVVMPQMVADILADRQNGRIQQRHYDIIGKLLLRNTF